MQRGATQTLGAGATDEKKDRQHEGAYRNNFISGPTFEERGKMGDYDMLLKSGGPANNLRSSRQGHLEQSSGNLRLLHGHNHDNQVVSQTNMLQQIQQQMLHFQLEQQKQMQSMELFNNKFENVMGKLNSIQQNHDQLNS